MHWILQNNLFNEKEWESLVSALDRFSIPYSVHKVIPFIGELENQPTLMHEKVICFGSYSMRHMAKRLGWTPGVYDLQDVDFRVQVAHWGDLMLNADARVCPFKNAFITEDTFIRPIHDTKHFAGAVFSPEEFEAWHAKVCVLEEDYGTSMTKDTMVQLCSTKKIYAEYRFWIVDGKIVTSSLYKRGDRVIYSSDVDTHVHWFAQAVIKHGDLTASMGNHAWQPHRAYVLDVCETPNGMKIVEINTINAAGFYAGDIAAVVMALEEMESRND